jgi:hypothetical protein
LLLAGVILVFPVVGVLAFAGSAYAAKGVSCSYLSGSINPSTGKVKGALSGCTDTKNTGGQGKFKGTETSTSGKITWNGTGTTTDDKVLYRRVTPSICRSGDYEDVVTGYITGGTGAAARSIKAGWTLQAYVCFDPTTGGLSLAPGKSWEIGPNY